MDPMVLTDKSQFPTEAIVFSHIGKTKSLWKVFFSHLHAEHADFSEEWRYYNDGKSWLMKVTRKSKTIFWLAVIKDAFRITFYFTDRVEPAIESSPVSERLKEQFRNAKNHGKLRGLTVTFRDKTDVEDAKALIPVKLAAK